MQSQLAENSRPPIKKIKRETGERIGNKTQFNFNVDILDDTQESIHHVKNNDTDKLNIHQRQTKEEKQVNQDCRQVRSRMANYRRISK